MQKPSFVASTTLAARRRQPIFTPAILTVTLACALIPPLASCGNSSLSSTAGYFREGVLGGSDLAMSESDVAKIPYASIAVRLGRGPQAFVVMAEDDGVTQQWVSADKHLIETQNGRVTKTIGFDQDLSHTSFITKDPLENHLDPAKTYATERLIDLTDHTGINGDIQLDTILVRSILTCQGPRTITILNKPIQTYLWTETTTAPQIKWNQTNKYWQDQNQKIIWKSRQNLAQNLQTIEIITLRKYPEE